MSLGARVSKNIDFVLRTPAVVTTGTDCNQLTENSF